MDGIPIQPLSKKELAGKLNVSLTTLRKWLLPFKEEIGAYRGKRFTPRQVQLIKSKLE